MINAAMIYQKSPKAFKITYASSNPAFLKDSFFHQAVSVNSFAPFRTGENPAMTQDAKQSQLCAQLYQRSNPSEDSVAVLFFSEGRDRVLHETMWIEKALQNIHQTRLGQKDNSGSIVPPLPHQNSR